MTALGAEGQLVFRPTPEIYSYSAYADNPVPLFFRELDAMFPKSKFVLTFRDVDAWIDSVEYIFEAWWDSWGASPEGPLIEACHRGFYGTARFDRLCGREAYLRHNNRVREYFVNRPGDLLELDMTRDNQWNSICHFLSVPVPQAPFPRLNVRGT
jgi:hypothetical protein